MPSVTDAPTPYAAVLASNIKAERARCGITQASCARRMRALGFDWHPQTVGAVERSERRLSAEEVLGLALVLESSMTRLMSPWDATEFVQLPSGKTIRGMTVVRSVLFHLNDRSVLWSGDEPVFGESRAGEAGGGWDAIKAALAELPDRAGDRQ